MSSSAQTHAGKAAYCSAHERYASGTELVAGVRWQVVPAEPPSSRAVGSRDPHLARLHLRVRVCRCRLPRIVDQRLWLVPHIRDHRWCSGWCGRHRHGSPSEAEAIIGCPVVGRAVRGRGRDGGRSSVRAGQPCGGEYSQRRRSAASAGNLRPRWITSSRYRVEEPPSVRTFNRSVGFAMRRSPSVIAFEQIRALHGPGRS